MINLVELYEMVSLNDRDLRAAEKLTIVQAGLALRAFEKAMQAFTAELSRAPVQPPAVAASRRPHGASAVAAQIHD
jgi:hypothetical protein